MSHELLTNIPLTKTKEWSKIDQVRKIRRSPEDFAHLNLC